MCIWWLKNWTFQYVHMQVRVNKVVKISWCKKYVVLSNSFEKKHGIEKFWYIIKRCWKIYNKQKYKSEYLHTEIQCMLHSFKKWHFKGANLLSYYNSSNSMKFQVLPFKWGNACNYLDKIGMDYQLIRRSLYNQDCKRRGARWGKMPKG